jgi:hypothetical protein
VRRHHEYRSPTKKTQPVEHQPFYIARRDTHSALYWQTFARQQRCRDVVAVSPASLRGMGRRHPVAVAIEDQARQQARRLGAHRQGALSPIGGELLLDDLPKFWRDDRLVLAGVDLALVRDLAAVKPVLQHEIERAAREALAAGKRAAGSFPPLTHNAYPIQLGFEQRHRAKFRIAPKNQPDGCRLGFVDDQSAVLDIIAERHIATHPHPLGLRRRDLVADALTSDLADRIIRPCLQLRERRFAYERQAARREAVERREFVD